MTEIFIKVFEIIGTIAFAMSGAAVAIEKKMDLLGVVSLGITTAIGGGIVRDILIGVTPPVSLCNPLYAIIALFVSIIVFDTKIRKYINMDMPLIVFIDAVGLGAFTIVGCNSAVNFDSILLQIFLGMLTGVGGGVIRDVFAAQRPMIFVKHFYALASMAGAIVYSIILPYNDNAAIISGMIVVVILRMLAAKYKWHLPKA